MSELARTQALLAEAFRRTEPLVRDPILEALAAGNERLSPTAQLEIYREQFWLRHLDVLRDDFAALVTLLGAEAFEQLARAYLAERPSSSFSLRDLGAELPHFIAARGDPFAAEVARVEWAFVECFDGPDTPPFDASSIAGIAEDAWPGARVVLDPSLQLLRLEHPAHDYRIAARKEAEPPARPTARACAVVVYRGPERLHCLEIEASAAALLEALATGTPLGAACERVFAIEPDVQTRLAGWFSEWTSLGWIRGVAPMRAEERNGHDAKSATKKFT